MLLTGEASSLSYTASEGDICQPSHWVAGLGGQATLSGHKDLGGLPHLGCDNNFYYSGMEGVNFLTVLSNREKGRPTNKPHRVETGADMIFLKGISRLTEIIDLESLSN